MSQGPAVSPQAGVIGEENRRQRTGPGLGERGHNVASGETQQATEDLTPVAPATGGEVISQAQERLRTFKEDTDDYVRKNPSKAVFTALGIGFVLGLMRRR
ncbi:MAG TPA: DUF883 C-terminal domain-containing protein [Candidatus Udaeobacter sp.]